MPDELFEAIINARMDSRHDHLNSLLEHEKYQILKRRKRQVLVAEDFTDSDLKEIANAPPAEAAVFNHEFKE